MNDEIEKPARRRLRKAIGAAAPEIARALGGPLAGAAAGAVARAILGREDAPEEEIAAAVERADAPALLALREAEIDFRRAVAELALEGQRLDASDRANARARETALRDRTPSALGALILIGFFAVMAVMAGAPRAPGAETEFSIMLGALATMAAAVVNYFFGSSAGSREKNALLTGRRLSETEPRA